MSVYEILRWLVVLGNCIFTLTLPVLVRFEIILIDRSNAGVVLFICAAATISCITVCINGRGSMRIIAYIEIMILLGYMAALFTEIICKPPILPEYLFLNATFFGRIII